MSKEENDANNTNMLSVYSANVAKFGYGPYFACKTIAEFPVTDPANMDAWNMQAIARHAIKDAIEPPAIANKAAEEGGLTDEEIFAIYHELDGEAWDKGYEKPDTLELARKIIAADRASRQVVNVEVQTWMHRLGPDYNDSKEATAHEVAMEAEIAELREVLSRQVANKAEVAPSDSYKSGYADGMEEGAKLAFWGDKPSEKFPEGWPAEIWLNAGDDELGPFSEYDEVSWCSAPQGGSDIRYIREDLLATPPATTGASTVPSIDTPEFRDAFYNMLGAQYFSAVTHIDGHFAKVVGASTVLTDERKQNCDKCLDTGVLWTGPIGDPPEQCGYCFDQSPDEREVAAQAGQVAATDDHLTEDQKWLLESAEMVRSGGYPELASKIRANCKASVAGQVAVPEAVRVLREAIQKQLAPDWECNSNHPALFAALKATGRLAAPAKESK